MDIRQSIHSEHAKTLDTDGLRREFLIDKIFDADNYTLTYSRSHHHRRRNAGTEIRDHRP